MKGDFFVMDENARILTVYDFLSPSYLDGNKKYSRILLQGKWLRDLGFTVGKQVSVKVANLNDKVELCISLVD